MQVTININDESKFKAVIEKELDALDKDELKQIIVEGIREGLKDNDYDLAKRILVKKSPYSTYDTEPSELTKELVRKADVSGIQEVADAMINDLKENHSRILERVLLDLMIDGLTNKYEFQSMLKRTLSEIRRDCEFHTY